MEQTFYFYDLETSGFNPKEARIMQFAGQRTDMDLNPLGKPHNLFIKFPQDSLPDPGAVLVTGITPQQTIAEGKSEAEFLRIFTEEIATPHTIMVGFNTVRFDDEFIRYLRYRNFYDPYDWQWRDGRSKWDLLDVVRMTRALRPEGINWPFDANGKPTNRLELLTALNGLDHQKAHDAADDVQAAIAVARLIKEKQPKLFGFLLEMRDKQKVAKLVYGGEPFVYTSGRFASEFEKTTVVALLAEHPKKQAALVFDLRYDPKPFAKLKPAALAEAWRKRFDSPGPRLPVKTLIFNRCPAIAPLKVLDEASLKRLKLNLKTINRNHQRLLALPELKAGVLEALNLLDKQRQTRLMQDQQEVDNLLYDGFFEDADQRRMHQVREAVPDQLARLDIDFDDSRLQALLPLYKARNFPETLKDEEWEIWESYRLQKLTAGKDRSRLAKYFRQLDSIEKQDNLTDHQQYLLTELRRYGENLVGG